MKWLFILLVLLNVAFFIWQLNAEQSDPAAGNAESNGNVRSLVLLSEMDTTQLQRAKPRENEASTPTLSE